MDDVVAHDRGEVTLSKKDILKKIQTALKEGVSGLQERNLGASCYAIGQARLHASLLQKEDIPKNLSFLSDIDSFIKDVCKTPQITETALSSHMNVLQKLEQNITDILSTRPKSTFWGN